MSDQIRRENSRPRTLPLGINVSHVFFSVLQPLIYTDIKFKFIIFLNNATELKILVSNFYMDHMKTYNIFSKHFPIWCTF
jgi:hypothetical protein